MRKILPFIVVVLIIIITDIYLYKLPQKEVTVTPVTNDTIVNSAIFNCLENKNIKAIFYARKLELNLSDGRNLILPQNISASGARYTNSDESFIFWNKGDTAFVEEKGVTTFKECSIPQVNSKSNQINNDLNKTTLTNPASTNCTKVGGNLIIEKNGNGDEYGLCYFEDNRACEEWALLGGECPLGGVKTTGYDSVDQKYCAWSGGQTFAVTNSICVFKDKSKCSTIDFYNGRCIKGKVIDSPVVCPMIAKLCPDGASVGPTGPNCEFVCSK
ncbi:MAG: DUF333 domain-containing protein [Candidatus Nomurabacteria bacterium]